MNCRRCGFCCICLPSWDELPEQDKAIIRQHDRGAEELFKKVKDGRCPNLVINRKGEFIATCNIYKKRHRFCKALKPNSEQCRFARK